MLKNLSKLFSGIFSREESDSSRGWTKEQEENLITMLKAGVSKKRVSEVTGRSLNSINYKLIHKYKTSNMKTLFGSK